MSMQGWPTCWLHIARLTGAPCFSPLWELELEHMPPAPAPTRSASVGSGFGETGLRPFELATVRLQNMMGGIIANWGSLKPADDELLVQQGGAVIFDSDEVSYFFRDKGILICAPVATALKEVRAEGCSATCASCASVPNLTLEGGGPSNMRAGLNMEHIEAH